MRHNPEIRVLGIGGSSLALLLSPNASSVGGWAFDVAPDVRGATEKLRSRPYDVVLVDFSECSVSESCVNEIAIIQEVKQLRPSTDVILLVEESTPQHVINAIRGHAFGYFSRPFDDRAVRDMILSAASVEEPPDSIEIMSASVNYLSLRVRCSLFTVDRLVQFMKEIPIELSADDRNEVAMAFREMLLNSIEHGGKLDPDEWVRVSRIRTNRTLVYHILDPGEGFSRESLDHAAVGNPNNPTAHVMVREEAGIRPGGFGMLITSSLVDEVIYNQQGNEVLLIKYLTQ